MDVMTNILLPALQEATATMPNPISISSDLALMGKDSVFDSLSFVSLIVLIEERLFDTTGKTFVLVDDKAFSTKNSPFRTVGTLCSYIEEKIAHESH